MGILTGGASGTPHAPEAAEFWRNRLRRSCRIWHSTIARQLETESTTSMAIYGTALLSACLLAGVLLGRLLGNLIGVDANIGGVGIAMLLLVVVCDQLQRRGKLKPPSDSGIRFWSSIYIPIVVAMAASQNVVKAFNGGLLALTAGSVVVVISFALVPVIARIGQNDLPSQEPTSRDGELDERK